MTQQGYFVFLTLTILCSITSCFASSRANSKRLRWDAESEQSLSSDKGDKGLTFINNEAYSLSRKHQKMMWDLYLRKGYAPSLSPNDDNHGDAFPAGSFPGTASVIVDPESHGITIKDGYYEQKNNNLRRLPNLITSRILNQYELSKAPRIVPEYETEFTNGKLPFHDHYENEIEQDLIPKNTTFETHTEQLVDTKVTSASKSPGKSLLSILWDYMKNYVGVLIGREIQDTIINTLWSLWVSIVEFAQSRGRRSLIHDQILSSLT